MKKILYWFFILFSTAIFSQSLDTTFGTSGIVTNQISTIPSIDAAMDAVLQPDGKIVYVGKTFLPNMGFISRINADGTSDTSFNLVGYRLYPTPVKIENVALQSDGKIVATGLNFITRLNTDGSLDSSFNATGTKVIQTNSPFSFYTNAVQMDGNGKIIISGFASTGENFDVSIIRLNSDGSFDTTFDGDGRAVFPLGIGNDYAYAMKIQSDGKIVLTGQSSNGTDYNLTTFRLNQNGSLDASFGTNGIAV